MSAGNFIGGFLIACCTVNEVRRCVDRHNERIRRAHLAANGLDGLKDAERAQKKTGIIYTGLAVCGAAIGLIIASTGE